MGQQKGASKGKRVVRQSPKTKPERTKLQQLEAMLRRSEGATIAELTTVLNWQAHSIRGAMSGALKRRKGLAITATRNAGGERVYRIVD